MKIIITTSHRPTPRTRSFLKDLVSIIPNSIRITRGKATLSLLTLQAIDIGADRLVVIRNWKGNPKFIDFYVVSPPSTQPVKICTLNLCGVKLAREAQNPRLSSKPSKLVTLIDKSMDVLTESILECLSIGLNIDILETEERDRVCRHDRNVLLLSLKDIVRGTKKGKEISFVRCDGTAVGPVIRICSVRLFLTKQK